MNIQEIDKHSIQINGKKEHTKLIKKFKNMNKKMRDNFRDFGMFSNYVKLVEQL